MFAADAPRRRGGQLRQQDDADVLASDRRSGQRWHPIAEQPGEAPVRVVAAVAGADPGHGNVSEGPRRGQQYYPRSTRGGHPAQAAAAPAEAAGSLHDHQHDHAGTCQEVGLGMLIVARRCLSGLCG